MATKAQEAKARKFNRKFNNNTIKYKTRQFNRCKICGRARGYIRYFGLCRIDFRKYAREGLIPGVRKASW
jgi:small subunit ribosomal protein S14